MGSSDVVIESKPWYDVELGFKKALENGLDGLREIAAERHEAGYNRKERLGWWCVIGYFIFDECGNTMKITEGRPTYDDFGKSVPRIFTRKELECIKHSMTSTFGSVPPTDEVCPRCLEGWTLHNVADYKAIHDYSTETWTHYHQRCHDLKVTQNEIKFFTEILKDAEVFYSEMRLIPAEYPDRPSAPWFMVETDLGPVKIGYRRRVISIEWPHAEGLKEVNGDELFKEEGVTTGKSLVHAWGKEKAVDYLRRLMRA